MAVEVEVGSMPKLLLRFRRMARYGAGKDKATRGASALGSILYGSGGDLEYGSSGNLERDRG